MASFLRDERISRASKLQLVLQFDSVNGVGSVLPVQQASWFHLLDLIFANIFRKERHYPSMACIAIPEGSAPKRADLLLQLGKIVLNNFPDNFKI